MTMREFLADVIGPFFFTPKGGKHRAPPKVSWWNVFDDQMKSMQDSPYKKFLPPVEINDKGAYFIPMSTDPKSGDGYFFTSTGKRLWGRYGAAGVMVRSRNTDGVPVYLLAQRSASISGGGGTWAVPGGAIDKGEKPKDGGLRELTEELGDLPTGSGYKVVGEDVNELEDGWKYTTVLAEVDQPFVAEGKDWETAKGKDKVGWFTEGQIKQMHLHPAMADRLDLLFDEWHKKVGGAHKAPRDDDVTKHLPGLHNQKSHGNRGPSMAPWLLDGGGFLNENEWNLHKWAWTNNIGGYRKQYDDWYFEHYNEQYLPWDAPDAATTKPPKGAPDPNPPTPTTPVATVDDWVDQVMGDEGKPHVDTVKPVTTSGESVTVTGSLPKNLTLVDERKDKDTVPLVIDGSKMPLIYDLAEIPEQAEVELRLRTPKPGDPYGSTQHVSGDKFIVRINILPLDKIATEKGPTGSYPDDSLYVINNTVVHELRHVGQHYVYKQMDADYAKELATKGYKGNFYEKEGWLWGHYADATGTKSTSDNYEGTPMALKQPLQGYAVWAVTPPGWTEPPKES